jgi:hypothetical protein
MMALPAAAAGSAELAGDTTCPHSAQNFSSPRSWLPQAEQNGIVLSSCLPRDR